jgi:ribosome-binding protein aMBF1 (putative translation factor)
MASYSEFSRRVAEEAETEGPDAIRELHAFEDYYRLARQIAERRLELRKSQEQLSAETGVGQSEISRIEQGRANPTYRTLMRLARGLGVRFCLEPIDPSEARRDGSLTAC